MFDGHYVHDNYGSIQCDMQVFWHSKIIQHFHFEHIIEDSILPCFINNRTSELNIQTSLFWFLYVVEDVNHD